MCFQVDTQCPEENAGSPQGFLYIKTALYRVPAP